LIKAVLFDLDGTLVDSNELHISAWQEVFAKAGHSFDRRTIHDQVGKGGDMLVPALLPDAPDEQFESLAQAHGEVFRERYIEQVRPFPGARELVARVCEAGQQVVLASSASKADLDYYFDLLDLRGLVTATTSADDVEHTKPAPDIFAAALKKVAPVGADEAMVVGDTPYDMEAAARCGIAAIGVRSGKFSDADLQGAGALALFDDVAALLRNYENSPLGGASKTMVGEQDD
jgi:HAD superfamily hydrolase (TIGR01509 family)